MWQFIDTLSPYGPDVRYEVKCDNKKISCDLKILDS